MSPSLRVLAHSGLSAILALSSCAEPLPSSDERGPRVRGGVAALDGSSYLSWQPETGEFYSLGEWIGTVSCSDYADPRIYGDDVAFLAFVAEKCSANLAPLPPLSEPCAGGTYEVAADGSSYAIDTCVPTSAEAPDPYSNAVAQWVRLPDWATNYDAECTLLPDGSGCCNFYVPIDPAELSACDLVIPVPLFDDGYEPTPFDIADLPPGDLDGVGGATYGLAREGGDRERWSALAAFAFNDGPTPPPPGPPPGSGNRNVVTSRIGGLIIGVGMILGGFNGDLGRVVRELGERVVRQVQRAEEQQRKIQRQNQQRPAAPGAPPEPGPPPTGRFQRGGRMPPVDPRPPTIPPRVLPPGGRPVTKPGQVAPQPPVRPPVRPRGG